MRRWMILYDFVFFVAMSYEYVCFYVDLRLFGFDIIL